MRVLRQLTVQTRRGYPCCVRLLPHTLALTLFLTSLGAAGCDEPEPWKTPGPKDVFDQFLIHWFRGEAEIAFDYVLPADRDALTAPLSDPKLPAEMRPEPHEMLVVAEIENVYDIDKMEVSQTFDTAPPEGQRVTLTLHHQDGSTSDADLVWSEGRWYVDLPIEPKS